MFFVLTMFDFFLMRATFFDDLKKILFPPSAASTTSHQEANATYEKSKERRTQEDILNSNITDKDIAPFKGKPFELSGEFLYEANMPYFIPTAKDRLVIEDNVTYIANKILETEVFENYSAGGQIYFCKIVVTPYTSTKKIKKFPVQVQLRIGSNLYQLYYSQSGNLEKAKISYNEHLFNNYTIDLKTFSDGLHVRRICLHPATGGSTKELYIKE